MGRDHHHGSTGDPLDDEICVCFHVRRRKVEAYCRREKPKVISLMSECLSAGTGCGWCIPFLKAVHREVLEGGPRFRMPTPEEYVEKRRAYHREKGIVRRDSPSSP